MKYERTYIDGSKFLFGLGDNIKFHKSFDLPMIEFTNSKVKYKVTDMRPLNENAVLAFEHCLTTAATVKDAESCKFCVPTDFDNQNNTVELICDIVTGVRFEARKGGKNGYSLSGRLLLEGYNITTDDDGNRIIEFVFFKDHAKVIYEYWQENGNDSQSLNLNSIVVAIAEAVNKQMDEVHTAH